MACRNCYKYPLCEKCETAQGNPLYYDENGKQKCNCPDYKSRFDAIYEDKEWIRNQIIGMLED